MSAAGLERAVLGRAGVSVTRSGFGALPVQRIPFGDGVALLRAARDGGINFFDTARGYGDSEAKIGAAFSEAREKVVIASKSPGLAAEDYAGDLEESLKQLRTDYIDIYQFHLAKKCHRPGEPDGLYEAATAAKASGKIRHIGLTTHRLDVAAEAAGSGLYDTVQFPLSYLSDDKDLELASVCRENDVGLIAMKALAGGLVTDARPAWVFLRRYENVVPIWGIQRVSELDEFLSFEHDPPAFSEEIKSAIARDREDLSGNYCRGCAYCLPCPANIELNWVTRMTQVLRRLKTEDFLTPEWRAKMALVDDCVHCGACGSRCPYELDTPTLIAEAWRDYKNFTAEWDARPGTICQGEL
ncbi:MAG: aldo/keto reductase [Synergistaceae bacterium]|jgi:predicted aldo/keto reductase-like oxidoreductase|nr:aldo/keto reductase [Synergistaceae bacterium]